MQLTEADRRKDEFLAMLGHELRNPLAGICNGVEVLGHLNLTDAMDIQGIISRQAKHMKNLIDDLLDVTRIARQDPAKKNAFRHRKLGTTGRRRPTREYRGGRDRIRMELPSVPICCEGDPIRLSQVLSNILTNATKFLGGSGEIVVSVGPLRESKRVTISVPRYRYRHGRANTSRFFRPFVQASQSLDRSEGGLGLGLALVRGIVELHGGQVTASSPASAKAPSFKSSFRFATSRFPKSRHVRTARRCRGECL